MSRAGTSTHRCYDCGHVFTELTRDAKSLSSVPCAKCGNQTEIIDSKVFGWDLKTVDKIISEGIWVKHDPPVSLRFYYNSTRKIGKKIMPMDVCRALAKHVSGYFEMNGGTWDGVTLIQLQEILLNFRAPDGSRLMIHQLEPFFLFLARYGRIWPDWK